MISKQFDNILVPVDFTENTEVATSKALEFCQGKNETTIHLYHVQRIVPGSVYSMMAGLLAGYTQRQINSDIESSMLRLEKLKMEIMKDRSDVNINCWVEFGETVQKAIIQQSKRVTADLIVIGKHSHHTLFPFLNTVVPSGIASVTGIPVLTAKPGSLHQEIKTVVTPIGGQFPDTKLEVLETLQRKAKPHVRLVTFPDEGKERPDRKLMLLHAFRSYKSRLTYPVQYEVLDRGNKARTLLKYCAKVGADVLIVYPGSETQVNNWANTQITDLIPAQSKMQILAVPP